MVLIRHILLLSLLLLAAIPPSGNAAVRHTLKFATLAPPGSTWMNILEDWGHTVAERSNGRLVFKFYPGGVQGDEPDVIRKMRFNQLQGAALTGYGIGQIYSPPRILEIPFLFRDYDEIDHVRAQLMPGFEQGFHEEGYELLGWMEIGFVYFFSQKPITSFDDLRKLRIWMWQGDPLGEAMFRASGLSPVPLSITDVFTSLSTGLIDTVYCTPLASIALQWFTKVDYVTNLPMANGIGGLLVSRRFFDRLPPDLQQLLRETGAETSRELIRQTRIDNARSLEVLREEGLQFVLDPDQVDQAELERMRDQAAAQLTADSYIPRPLFERTRALLEDYRHGLQAQGAAAAGGE